MQRIIKAIANWTPVHPKDRIEQIKNRAQQERGSVHRCVLGDRVSPLDLYAYLKARFGHPNGIQMLLRNPSSDNICHWHFTVRAGTALLDIWQSNLVTEIYAKGIESPVDSDWDELIAAIKADFRRHGPDMSRVRKDLEQWHLFINPYKRLRDVLENCRRDLISLDIDSVEIPETPVTSEQLHKFTSTLAEEQKRFEEALRLGVTIRMLAPVLGEAFVNLVLFLLAKPEIKKDHRLYEDAIRRDIDVRVKGLHLNCDGFKKPVDASSTRFKDFNSLMNGRNDFLHGNVDPTKLKFDTVYFDYRTVPVFEKRASFGELALSHRLIHVEPEKAMSDLEIVDQFIELVMESVSDEVRELVDAFQHATSPGWKPDDGRVGLLFPENVVHTIPGDGPREDEGASENGPTEDR